MSVTLKFWLPDEVLFANAWGHIRAEENVEVLPSPLRILRALVCRSWQAQIPAADLQKLIEALAQELPVYSVPRFEKVVLHQPVKLGVLDRAKGTPEQRILVNAGVAFDPGTPIVMTWRHLNLRARELELLRDLCDRITYLGRVNSPVDIEVTTNSLSPQDYNGKPCDNGQSTHRLLVPLTPNQYQEWLNRMRELNVPQNVVPPDLLGCLNLSTEQKQTLGYTLPPGAQWMTYQLEPHRPVRQYATPKLDKPVELVRVSFSHPVLPPITDALRLGEAVRSTLAIVTNDHLLVTGKDAAGNITQQPHLKYLPEPDFRKAVIPSVLLYLQGGIPLDLLQQIQGLTNRQIEYCVRKKRTLPMVVTHSDRSPQFKSPLIGNSRVWHSLTPFRMRFYPVVKQNKVVKYSLAHQVQVLLQYAGYPAPVEINEIPLGTEIGRFLWAQYRTQRTKQLGGHGPKTSHGLEIVFAEPVSGPLSIGYASHFGNGIFVPVDRKLSDHQIRSLYIADNNRSVNYASI